MDIYIGPLDKNISIEEVKAFLGWSAWRASVHIVECADGEREHRYAVASNLSDKRADKLITKLNGTALDDTRVEVKAHHYRAVQNERRAPGWIDQKWKATERRNTERRNMTMHGHPDDEFL